MFKKLLSTGLLALLIIVLAYARIGADISPFAAALLCSLAITPVVKLIPAAVFILVELWRCPEQFNMLAALFTCGVYLLACLVLRWCGQKKPWQILILLGAFLGTQGWNIYWGATHPGQLVPALISVVIGIIFLLACLVCVRTIRQKKFLFPWTVDQIICLMTVVVVAALGLCGFANPYFDVHQFVTILVVFLGVYYAEAKTTVLVAAALGLGKAFATMDLVWVAVAVLLAAACFIFKHRNRIFSVVAVLLTDLVLGFYFQAIPNYNIWNLLPIAGAVLVFLAIPPNVARRFTFGSGSLGGFLVSKNTINRNTAGISLRMRSLAAVFNEMQNTYRQLTHEALPPRETAALLSSEISATVCAQCPHKAICRKTTLATQEVEDGLTTLAKTALKHQNATLLDVPNGLAIRCTRLNTLLGAVNRTVASTKNKAQIIAGLDSGKILMANLLSGISQLCQQFAGEVCRSVVFDTERGELVKEELLYKNIYAEDCLITKTNRNEFVVSVLVPRDAVQHRRIEKVVSKVCGHKMIVDEVVDADTKGYAIVSVRSAPKYTVLFGMAGVTKGVNQQSGDNFSFLRVTNEKTLMALCDGMGAGERAARASTLALSLVENFYKAGFPDEIIMHSVNQLLTFTGQDIFSALDLSVFDLSTGETDFIKVGAADGYIKRAREVEVVEAGSLPLGILDEITPKITKAVLSAGDQVILVSDGVLDAFGGDRVQLAGFINNLDAATPQQLADELIAAVLKRSPKNPADDCTVTVAQLGKM